MRRHRSHLAAAVLSLAVLAALPALAHTMLKSSSIEEGAVLTAQPNHLELTFDHDVGLSRVDLVDSVGEAVALTYKPPKTMATSFDIPLPTLQPDSYKLSWRAAAKDGHVMTGDLNFAIAAQ